MAIWLELGHFAAEIMAAGRR